MHVNNNIFNSEELSWREESYVIVFSGVVVADSCEAIDICQACRYD